MKPIVETINGFAPFIEESAWLAPNATVLGDVHIGANCSIWFQAVLRGDVGAIRMGNDVNIQDGVIIHATSGKSKVQIGNRVSIGHRAIVHGCTIEDDVLIGMGAIVMDNAVVQRGALVAAGSVVLENTIVESGTIWAGVPAKEVKRMDVEQAVAEIQKVAASYVGYKAWYEGDREV